jgi:hypothetical protein
LQGIGFKHHLLQIGSRFGHRSGISLSPTVIFNMCQNLGSPKQTRPRGVIFVFTQQRT